MTAQVLEFRPRGAAPLLRTRLAERHPRIVDVAPWWHCPTWCDGDCTGGEAFDYGNGDPQFTSRRHYRTVFSADNSDSAGYTVAARVEVSAIEDPDDGWLDTPTIDIDIQAVLEPDAVAALTQAVTAAAELARQPLPALSPRPSSEGGGRPSTSGRGTPRSPARVTPLESA